MSEKLLPCPFCGGEATIDNAGGKYQAWCKHCCCIHIGEFYNTEAEAIAAWNRRTDHIRDTTKKVSNADRIRGMSDEELAKFIKHLDSGLDEICDIQDISQDGNGCDRHENCYACYLDWLKQPAKEEHHEA